MNTPVSTVRSAEPAFSGLDPRSMLDLYRPMAMARAVDRLEAQYTACGEAFFHVSGAGHEASAALAFHLGPQDWLHPHYRDKALLLARGVNPEMFFQALFCKDGAHSRGRQMSAHMSWPHGHVLSLCGPVGNNALQSAGVAAEVRDRPGSPVVVCGLGDGTTQQGEVMEAIAESVRRHLPVLFLVEDNRFAISTHTAAQTFYSLPGGDARHFYGLPIHRMDGRDAVACHLAFGKLVGKMRRERGPLLLVMHVERLDNHTNADDQTIYRNPEDIAAARATADPVQRLEAQLLEGGMSAASLAMLREEIADEVREAARRALVSADPPTIHTARLGTQAKKREEYRGDDRAASLTMLAAMNRVLSERMAGDPCISLYGEDIEDPKGDVFGITRGLSTRFPGRVLNSPLSESTILGTAIGRALAGGRPVAFLQFADFLPLAFNQIASELGSMYWRTDGGWRCPVVVIVPCGGYRPGLGPFHAQSFESVVAHVPGIDVVMPSNAADAAGLLNAALDSGRPTLFFCPKACLNDRTQMTSNDALDHYVPIGRGRLEARGDALTFVSYGNGMERCRKAAAMLRGAGHETDVIDLRSLSPWDEALVLQSVRRTRKLLVVHEDNRTCGFGAEIAATVVEKAGVPVQIGRVVREDTYVPCHFPSQLEVLPSVRRVLTAAAEMLDLAVRWDETSADDAGLRRLDVVGVSPSDESVVVVQLHVQAGDVVTKGQTLASFETTKTIADFESPAAGVVAEIFVREGDTVPVGAPLLTLRASDPTEARRPQLVEEIGNVRLLPRTSVRSHRSTSVPPAAEVPVGILGISTVVGGVDVSNSELAERHPGRTADEIFDLTGIRVRHWIAAGETVVSLGAGAVAALLRDRGLALDDVDALICCTVTPAEASPSVACQILGALGDAEVQAFDINAACSGYLYALRSGVDFIRSQPDARVVLVTAEVLSPLLDPNDFSTSIIFGDAAAATLLASEGNGTAPYWKVDRPCLLARGDSIRALTVPGPDLIGRITMDGEKVFVEAVRKMSEMLRLACTDAGIAPDALDLVVPHQANQRILDAVARRLRVPRERVYSNIVRHGNTSSCTIPLCLAELAQHADPPRRIGLVAFGGGFTYGATVLHPWN